MKAGYLKTEQTLTDARIREPLFEYLEGFYGKIRILEEKNAGASRADVLGIVEGEILGFEIKSDRDSYARLKTQTADYDALCDYNYLVIGKSHLQHAHEHVPPHWGILVAYQMEDGEIYVEMDQLPARNRGAQLKNQLALLWRPELEMLLARSALPGYHYKSKAFVQEKLLEKVDPAQLKLQITELLIERDYQALLDQIYEVRKERAARRGKTVRRKRRIRRKKAGK